MATYLVGDLQGCLDDLHALLAQVNFNSLNDHLWLTGDLVARGPKSLETLRFIQSLGDHAHTVLGNHDLHLLATAAGFAKPKEKDHIQPILDAADRDQLLNWLRHQPLLLEHPSLPFVITHAGIPPQWDLDTARKAARNVESILQSDDYLNLLKNMYGNGPDQWSPDLSSVEKLRFTINAFTRMRFCFPDGRLDMQSKLPPHDPNISELIPWFNVSDRKHIEKKIIFGHWAALMGYEDNNVVGLDTGCVWGESLTLLRWEDGQYFATECPIYA